MSNDRLAKPRAISSAWHLSSEIDIPPLAQFMAMNQALFIGDGNPGGEETMSTTRKVTTHAVNTGIHFGTIGVVRDAKTGRKLATTDRVYPYGFAAAAREGAASLAESKGWTVVAEVAS